MKPEVASLDITCVTYWRSDGSLIAFIGIVLYFGHRRLAQTISELSSRMEPALVASYAVLVSLAIVAAVLLIGLWDMVAGRSANTQGLRRRRLSPLR
jgi:hypothetical protein